MAPREVKGGHELDCSDSARTVGCVVNAVMNLRMP